MGDQKPAYVYWVHVAGSRAKIEVGLMSGGIIWHSLLGSYKNKCFLPFCTLGTSLTSPESWLWQIASETAASDPTFGDSCPCVICNSCVWTEPSTSV